MADVQPDRAMPVHRDILPALCLAGLSLSELKIALAVLRASWGWSETTTRHRFSQTMAQRLSGLGDRKKVKAAMKRLEAKGVIEMVRPYDAAACLPAEWQIAKDYDRWVPSGVDVPWRQAPGADLDPGANLAPGSEKGGSPRGQTSPEPRG